LFHAEQRITAAGAVPRAAVCVSRAGQPTREVKTHMTKTPRGRKVQMTADLLNSLQESINRLRREAEALRAELEDRPENGAEGDTTGSNRQFSDLNRLIRDCQKVETCLVEFQKSHAGGEGLDLDAARAEIRCRMARLRRCGSAGGLPE
jgi:endonuclease IV